MRPILFTIFGIAIKSYGFFLALGFLTGISLAAHLARKEKANPDFIYDISLYVLFAGIIGARLLEVLVNYDYYFTSQHYREILAVWNGGLTYYGGLIAALIVAVFYVRKKKVDFFQYADIVAPSLALGYMFGRIGCSFAGCCYGKRADSGHLCLTFTDPRSFAPQGVCLYPTQPYEAGLAFIIFLVLLVMRKYRTFKGQLFLMFFILYAPVRFMIEFIRDDFRGIYFNNQLSTSQIISIPFFIGAMGLYFYLKGKGSQGQGAKGSSEKW